MKLIKGIFILLLLLLFSVCVVVGLAYYPSDLDLDRLSYNEEYSIEPLRLGKIIRGNIFYQDSKLVFNESNFNSTIEEFIDTREISEVDVHFVGIDFSDSMKLISRIDLTPLKGFPTKVEISVLPSITDKHIDFRVEYMKLGRLRVPKLLVKQILKNFVLDIGEAGYIDIDSLTMKLHRSVVLKDLPFEINDISVIGDKLIISPDLTETLEYTLGDKYSTAGIEKFASYLSPIKTVMKLVQDKASLPEGRRLLADMIELTEEIEENGVGNIKMERIVAFLFNFYNMEEEILKDTLLVNDYPELEGFYDKLIEVTKY